MKYDYLIVGCGLFGSTFAHKAKLDKKRVLILDKRDHIAGNCYTEIKDNIHIHKYGPHIFHTNNEQIWNFITSFGEFNQYKHTVKSITERGLFSFPINLMTLYQLWGVTSPEEARSKLDSVKIRIDNPSNLEEWILSQVGEEIYYTFIYGYTKKQWNTEPKNLPSFIIKRLPIRLNFNDNYFYDAYQGIPINGYTNIIKNMVDGCDIILDTDYLNKKDYYDSLAKKIVYTGQIDQFFNYCFGYLDYRSLRFETQKVDVEDYQGCAIINYTSADVPYTRITEHKHFLSTKSPLSYITKEFPDNSNEPYYPINNELNNNKYIQYKQLCQQNSKYIFGGRLAEYKYYDMHQIIASSLATYNQRRII